MDLELNRCDYIQVVVGSQSGVVHSFGASRGHIETVFKTLPGKGVSCIQLGGPVGSIHDKIFVAAGNEITGYTRKGKQFLKFDTNLTDAIKCMSVCGNDLAVCGEYVYNHYFECQDKNHYLSSGRINDMLLLPVDKIRALVTVLACQDRLIRVLKSTPNHAWNVAFCPLREVNRRTGRTALRPLCNARRPIRLAPASSESFRALPFVFANRRADAHTRPPDEVGRLQSPKGLTCPPFRLS
ncbi:hypothetical protein HPB50_000807 [Hyalomma asiaticum]|uniref:Uncharacterized protein n=1 Tax=Hyalomma asiaticum TaxID=266040 RepID=A0ACB7SLJ2_HYAAI|nr:hypothetical protein HPB50_000807 [Hyalomma asiaticum]